MEKSIKRRSVMKRLLVFVSCVLIFAGCTYSEPGKRTHRHRTTKIGDEWLNVEISDSERDIISSYYHHHPYTHKKHKRLPPGLQKKAARGQALPPGWQKKLARGEVLDYEIYQHARRIPYELSRRLPPAPEGTVLIKVEGKIIRLYEATRTILDVFDVGR
jgi:hypothetical protein